MSNSAGNVDIKGEIEVPAAEGEHDMPLGRLPDVLAEAVSLNGFSSSWQF